MLSTTWAALAIAAAASAPASTPAPAAPDSGAPDAESSRLGPGSPPAPPPIVHSLLGGETLGAGGTVAAFSAGFSTLSAAYGQGVSAGLDWGLQLELDWLTTELYACGLLRGALWRSGDLLVAGRVAAGFYGDFGATYGASANRSDAGLEVRPGVAASTRVGSSQLTLFAELPLEITASRDGGFALGLLGGAVFETPIAPDLTVGGRIAAGSRWSSAGAPFAADSPRAALQVAAVLTYQLL